jgi:serine/threonine protein kinase
LSDRLGKIKEDLSAIFAAPVSLESQDVLHRMRIGSTLLSFQRMVRSSTFYAAPEEHERGGIPDARADIYSTGGVLYWLMVGFDPFELALRERNRSLYERLRAARDQKILHMDERLRRKLFGELAEIEGKMRDESLAIKRLGPVEVHYDELAISGVDQRCFDTLRMILEKCTHPDPARRYSNIGEVGWDLERACRRQPVGDAGPDHHEAASSP